ncbi:hypothetical protein CC86DRAFT_375290 [Ophiobolus disseminans]|uniref:DUF7607 domain-containing protein n=1 Tax=Ophiobolus disseminans TaxID=1469910 RepID=A0A6A6ZDC3_9PLEO|nr:hypothetical protein CC86DRAFT_375290 [Ophiobolus disseminans]
MALVAVIELLRDRSIAYKQHTATAGVQALNLGNHRKSATEMPRPTPVNPANATDLGGRKRQKVTHVTTEPLPSNIQHPLPSLESLAAMPGGQPTIDGSGDWDYLLRWEKSGEQVIDLDDLATDENIEDEESNDVGEYLDEDPQEAPDEVAEKEAIPVRSKLSTEQIVDIINEQIEHYTNEWTPNKGAAKGEEIDDDPNKLWDKAEADGERQTLARKYEMDFKYFEQRLDKLSKEVLDYAGNNSDIVRRQCGALEVTINSMLLSEWLWEIYKLDPVHESEEEEEEEELRSRSPGIEHDSPGPEPRSSLPTRRTPPPLEIIDLGSPSDSSQEQPDDMVIDSSPLPGAEFGEQQSSSPDRFHTPDSVMADAAVESVVEKPLQPVVPAQASTTFRPPRARPQQQYGDEPEKASITSARRWKWEDLVATQDRKRIVTKALLEMKVDDRETIRGRLSTVGKADMIREIPACIRMLAKNETKMQGVLARDMPKIVTFTRLFLCWWLCDNYFRAEPSKWRLEDLERCIEDGSPDPSTFCDYLSTIMTTTFCFEALRQPDQPSQAEIIDISSDDDEPAPKPATQRRSQMQRPQGLQRPPTIVLD